MHSDRDRLNHEIIAKMKRFTEWQYREIEPYISGEILEIGSGLGTYSEKIIKDFPRQKIWLSDINNENLAYLRRRFNSKRNVQIIKLNIIEKNSYKKFSNKFQSIVMQNVLEHVENDVFALNNLSKILKNNGRLLILVPAHKKLFNTLDVNTGHYRRYTKEEIVNKVSKSGYIIKKFMYFNFLSIFAWYINGTLFKKSSLNPLSLKIFDLLVPLIRLIENKILKNKYGISMILILEKSNV